MWDEIMPIYKITPIVKQYKHFKNIKYFSILVYNHGVSTVCFKSLGIKGKCSLLNKSVKLSENILLSNYIL